MLGNFACGRYRLILEPSTPVWLHSFAGSTLRGGFGHVFKRAVCVWPPGDCPRCLLKHTCSYRYIFETAPPPGAAKLRTLDQVPRPFVIEPPEDGGSAGAGSRRLYRPGERFNVRLVLIGRAMDYLPSFLSTFCELGRVGLGAGGGRFTMAEVHAEGLNGSRVIDTAAEGVRLDHGEPITAADLAVAWSRPADPLPGGSPRRFAVHFLTPTRIRNDGALRAAPTFQDLVRALLRRLSSLCYFHCGGALDLDFKGLIARSAAVRTVGSSLRWRDQERFSGRQRQRIEMGGVVGTVAFEAPGGDALAPFLPLLAAGEWVHVGKGCVLGLGKYRLGFTSGDTPNGT